MNKLLLLSGNDIPFIKAKINIHQPRLKQIAFLGEDIFYLSCNFLCFSKDNLTEKDKVNLINKTNFDILMSIINNKTDVRTRVYIETLLSLLFPQYHLMIMPNMLVFNKQTQQGKEQGYINNDNYEQFKSIIRQMFCLNTLGGEDYNPANKMAQSLAKKFRQRRKKLSEKKGDGNKSIDILSRYISILVLGNRHTYSQLMEYTVFQLFDQFQRFQKKFSYDVWFKAKLAGAQNLQDVDNWMSDEEQSQPRPTSGRIEF